MVDIFYFTLFHLAQYIPKNGRILMNIFVSLFIFYLRLYNYQKKKKTQKIHRKNVTQKIIKNMKQKIKFNVSHSLFLLMQLISLMQQTIQLRELD